MAARAGGPMFTQVELSDTVNLELRDWRPLLRNGAGAGLPLARSYAALARLMAMDFPPLPSAELGALSAWIPGVGVGYSTSTKRAAEALSEGTERYRPDYRPLRMPLLALCAGQSQRDRLLPSIPSAQQRQGRAWSHHRNLVRRLSPPLSGAPPSARPARFRAWLWPCCSKGCVLMRRSRKPIKAA
jgi:hypothetical protein